MTNNNNSEEKLNPAPYKYKVSGLTKILFLCFFIIGVGAYFYFIIDRRISQHKFRLENHVAAVRLTPNLLPAITVTDLKSGLDINLKDHVNQWTLLNIWATWCTACEEEMPSLEYLNQELGQKIKIIALSIDDDQQAPSEFIKTHKPSFSVFHDKKQASPALLNINKYPETFLISPNGMLTVQLSGPRNWASVSMNKYLLSFIK